MRRPAKRPADGPDGHYQLPHPDLVSQSDPVVQAAEVELQELNRLTLSSAVLLSDILDRSGKLGEAIDSLKAAGRCPDPLWNDSRAFFLALGLHTIRNPALSYDDHDMTCHSHDHDGEVISHNGGFQGGPEPPSCQIAQVLEGLGFREPQAVLHKYGSGAVQKALDRLNARPPGSVANRGAYLRAILNEVQP